MTGPNRTLPHTTRPGHRQDKLVMPESQYYTALHETRPIVTQQNTTRMTHIPIVNTIGSGKS